MSLIVRKPPHNGLLACNMERIGLLPLGSCRTETTTPDDASPFPRTCWIESGGISLKSAHTFFLSVTSQALYSLLDGARGPFLSPILPLDRETV